MHVPTRGRTRSLGTGTLNPRPPRQVCIPVPIPGQPPAAVALLGMAKADLRLLGIAEKLGPLVAEAAAALAAAAVEDGAASAAAVGGEPGAQDGAGDGVGRSAKSGAAATANGHAGGHGAARKQGTRPIGGFSPGYAATA